MAVDDSAMYTGVDGETDGIFGNEKPNEEVERKIQEQQQLVSELTPKLQALLDAVESERKLALEFIAGYVDDTKDDDSLMRGELKAAARYRKYLDGLKTKFTLALQEVRGK